MSSFVHFIDGPLCVTPLAVPKSPFPAVVVALRNRAPGQYVKSIRFGGMDITSGFRFDGRTAGTFEVVFGSGTGQITGVVVDNQCAPSPEYRLWLSPHSGDEPTFSEWATRTPAVNSQCAH